MLRTKVILSRFEKQALGPGEYEAITKSGGDSLTNYLKDKLILEYAIYSGLSAEGASDKENRNIVYAAFALGVISKQNILNYMLRDIKLRIEVLTVSNG